MSQVHDPIPKITTYHVHVVELEAATARRHAHVVVEEAVTANALESELVHGKLEMRLRNRMI